VGDDRRTVVSPSLWRYALTCALAIYIAELALPLSGRLAFLTGSETWDNCHTALSIYILAALPGSAVAACSSHLFVRPIPPQVSMISQMPSLIT
jgi:hypothetical protein